MDAYRAVLAGGVRPRCMGMGLWKIMDEWVQSPELTPFPKALLDELAAGLRRLDDSILLISYARIIEILERNDYQFLEQVRAGLEQFEGFEPGALVFVYVDPDPSDDFENNRTLKAIREKLPELEETALEIFASIHNGREADGLTVISRNADPESRYACVFVNRNAPEPEDTLEHQLTHFIRNVAGESAPFPKVYSGLTAGKLKSRAAHAVAFVSRTLEGLGYSRTAVESIAQIAVRVFTEREQHSMVKSVVNALLRHAEAAGGMEPLLDRIESLREISEGRPVLEDWTSRPRYERDPRADFLLKCIMYLGFKEIYPEYNIREIALANWRREQDDGGTRK